MRFIRVALVVALAAIVMGLGYFSIYNSNAKQPDKRFLEMFADYYVNRRWSPSMAIVRVWGEPWEQEGVKTESESIAGEYNRLLGLLDLQADRQWASSESERAVRQTYTLLSEVQKRIKSEREIWFSDEQEAIIALARCAEELDDGKKAGADRILKKAKELQEINRRILLLLEEDIRLGREYTRIFKWLNNRTYASNQSSADMLEAGMKKQQLSDLLLKRQDNSREVTEMNGEWEGKVEGLENQWQAFSRKLGISHVEVTQAGLDFN